MKRNNGREIAVKHLLTTWELIFEYIQEKSANTYDEDYYFNRSVFDKSLEYIEACDRKACERQNDE